MNPDPGDNPAWRSFGMLGPAESSAMEEAVRNDSRLAEECLATDRIAAAIAVVSSAPLRPDPQQLPELLSRIGAAKPRRTMAWLAAAGWAAAACLGAALLLNPRPSSRPAIADHQHRNSPIGTDFGPAPADEQDGGSAIAAPRDPGSSPAPPSAPGGGNGSPHPGEVRTIVRTETQRLVEQIEVLRQSLARHEQRERILFKAVPGMALPLMMEMKPPALWSPEDPALAANQASSPMEALVRDASLPMSLTKVTATDNHSETTPGATTPASDPPAAAAATVARASASGQASSDGVSADLETSPVLAANTPSAIPIYDAARDTGTIRIKDLPAADEGMVYHLWATFAGAEQATLVGSLPSLSGSGNDSFDFNLGSVGVMPSGYALTLSRSDQSSAPPPDASNTVLNSPPPAAAGTRND